MTQTIDQRARELLIRHYKLLCPPNMTFEDPPRPDWYEYNAAPIAALTEALTRIEELEGALRPIMNAASGWVHDKGNDTLKLYIAPDYSDGMHPHVFTLADLRRAATLTKGIRE